eukprot:g6254.t1
MTLNQFYHDLPHDVHSPPIESVVFGWGANEDGQLGCEHESFTPTPRVIESLLGSNLRGRAMGRSPLIGGSRNTLAISNDGMVWSWGWNDRGTLGRGHRNHDQITKAILSFKSTFIIQAAIGGWHCLALDNEGRVYAWGGNEYMQCSFDSSTRDILNPTHIVPQLTVKQVACGGMHSLVLTTSGEVWTWGEPCGEFALLHDKDPRCVKHTNEIVLIACGAFHNMALDRQGHVYTWGINDYGQLGHGNTRYSTSPRRVVDLNEVEIVDIVAGGWHSVALSKDGRLYIWGRGEYGRLGLGDKTGSSRLQPHLVPGLEAHFIIQAAAGGTHTMCLTSEGLLFIWGRGSFGRLGDGVSSKDQYSPKEVSLPGGPEKWKVLAIACGGRHNLCLAVPKHDLSSSNPSSSGGNGDDEGSEQENAQIQGKQEFTQNQSTPKLLPTQKTG